MRTDLYLQHLVKTFARSMKRSHLTAIVVLLIIATALTPIANAMSVTTTITPDSVTMNVNLSLVENLTKPLGTLSTTLNGASATNATHALQNALSEKVPGSIVESVEFNARVFNTSLTESVMQENYTIDLQGTSSGPRGLITTNVGFMFLNASDPIQVNGFELNAVGQSYLLAPLLATMGKGYRYYLSGGQFLNSVIPGNTTEKFRMLDFTFLPPLTLWTHQEDPLGSETSWTCTYASGCITNEPYNLTFGIVSPEGPLIQVRSAVFDPSFQIVAPARAWLQGNSISFYQPTIEETIMPIVALAFTATAIASLVVDRQLTRLGRIRTGRRRR
jgi:hypothetical protein